MLKRTRLWLEPLEDRCVPSHGAPVLPTLPTRPVIEPVSSGPIAVKIGVAQGHVVIGANFTVTVTANIPGAPRPDGSVSLYVNGNLLAAGGMSDGSYRFTGIAWTTGTFSVYAVVTDSSGAVGTSYAVNFEVAP